MTRMLWGGRFSDAPHAAMMRLTSSIGVDLRLLSPDLTATMAHAHVLAAAGLLGAAEVAAIEEVCEAIRAEADAGDLEVAPEDEDVHSLVERILTERLGEAGARIHAGRSRNDLVATDLRLWCRQEASELATLVGDLIAVVATLAATHTEVVMPGYTHLQRAQPVSFGFHLAAHGFALARDGDRFLAAATSADVSSLGAGALAGSTLPLDPDVARRELGFGSLFSNATDAVAERDFVCDLLYAVALCGVHLSRIGEEIVLWTSAEFGFASLPDAWSTGSSMMPQKRNPDLAELVRGRAAGGIADLAGLLGLLKGLPLAYDRDLQEDKGYLFRACDRLRGCLEAVTQMLGSLEVRPEKMADAAAGGSTWATDLAEALVARGVAFREAHDAVGRLVAGLEAQSLDLIDAPPGLLATYHPLLEDEDRRRADPVAAVRARSTAGGTAPARVQEQVSALRDAAEQLRKGAGNPSVRPAPAGAETSAAESGQGARVG